MTIAIILSTHGFTSKQLLKTTEMIAGKQQNIAWVDLLPEENTEMLMKKYSTHLSTLNISTGVLFLVDIWGGSPFNAANNLMANKKNYDIITGINIPMLIELCIERENNHSLKKLVKIALKCGKDSIKSVRNSTPKNNNHNDNLPLNTNIKSTLNTITTNSNLSFNKNEKEHHMIIRLARIDDRLIHGQVVTFWIKEYKIKRIIVVNNDICQDEMRSTLIKQASPPGITAHVINIDKTVRVYNNPKYAGEEVIMLFTNPSDIVKLIEKGVPITSVNIGGMAFYVGKKQINNVISVDQKDIEAFQKLDKYGINLEIRKIPSDSSVQIINLINNMNK